MLKHALIGEHRSKPKRGLKGICEGCRGEMISICGEKRIHHWRHKNTEECISRENKMTEWHLGWQSKFHESQVEIYIYKDRKYRIADVLGKEGTVIEFQNSPIDGETILDREAHYEKIIWIVNANKFIKNIELDDSSNSRIRNLNKWYHDQD